MAVTVEDIKAIRAGTSVPFMINHPKEINTVRSLCAYVQTSYPELGVTFHTKSHKEKSIVMVEARPKNR